MIWIAPTKPSEESNFFGNVTFNMDWIDVYNQFGPFMYLIDQSIKKGNGHTRILLTNREYTSLKPVNLDDQGSPLIMKDGQLHHIHQVQCKKGFGPHQIQIAIDTKHDGGKWFYANCDIEPNNHSDVNGQSKKMNVYRRNRMMRYVAKKCFKFNTAQGLECPYNFNAEQTKKKLDVSCPSVLDKNERLKIYKEKLATVKNTSSSVVKNNLNKKTKSETGEQAVVAKPKPESNPNETDKLLAELNSNDEGASKIISSEDSDNQASNTETEIKEDNVVNTAETDQSVRPKTKDEPMVTHTDDEETESDPLMVEAEDEEAEDDDESTEGSEVSDYDPSDDSSIDSDLEFDLHYDYDYFIPAHPYDTDDFDSDDLASSDDSLLS